MVVWNDRKYRAKNLLLSDRHAVVDVRKDSRLDEETLLEVLRPFRAAGHERCTLFDASLDVVDHALALGLRDQRSEFCFAFGWITDRELFRCLLCKLNSLLVTRSGYEHSRERRAGLPGIEITVADALFHCLREI